MFRASAKRMASKRDIWVKKLISPDLIYFYVPLCTTYLNHLYDMTVFSHAQTDGQMSATKGIISLASLSIMSLFLIFLLIILFLKIGSPLTTLTKKSWSNVGQNLVNRPTFDYALFGEHLTKVLVISWSNVGQKLVN